MARHRQAPLPSWRVSGPQRNAADPTQSVWVAASAGAGKTKVLTDRVMRLLLDDAPPARLLCLTFTRAAAAEMANRINRDLGRWTLVDDALLDAELEALTGSLPDDAMRRRARRLFAAVLDAPGGLKIMTIHAFCQSLLGRFPLEAGLAPHFEVLDERAAAELLRDAQSAVLVAAHAAVEPGLTEALAEVSGQVNEDAFHDLMDALRGARGRLRALLDHHGDVDGLIDATWHLLGVAAGETVDDVVGAASADGIFDGVALAAVCAALEHGSDADIARGARLAAWLEMPVAARQAAFDDYADIFLTKAFEPRARLITKAAQAADPAAEDALGAEQARLVDVIERRRAVTVARASAALLRLGGALLDEYDRHKAARARLDYDDLVLAAGRLLARPGVAPWVLYKLDGGLDHILVDEAQDTSPEQWRVIARLADEFFAGEGAREILRTVFVVGDEKQSIFSFQGADLAALAAMRAHFAARVRAADEAWQEVGLGISFRSTAAVLQAVDAVFANPAARDGVVFADHVVAHEAERKGHAGHVELWPLVADADADDPAPWAVPVERREAARSSARLARHIARTVHGWVSGGERLDARDRAVRPGDVLVLVRRRTVFVEELVRALKGLGVPVAGADRMVLTDQLAVMDLVALGEFLLLPDDDLTLAAVLKGPLIGLDEDALFDLAYGRRASLWAELVRRRAERHDYRRAHRTLAALLGRVDFVPPYELYAEILGVRGGRRQLVGRLGPDANDPIDEFLTLALGYERIEAPSLQGFLHWLAAGETQIKRDLDQARDEVRVMTVHGAKGLQAPIVILPDTTALPGGGRGATLLWHDLDGEEPALLWPVRTANDERRCRAARQALRDRESEEYRRLLYVAMTRAEDRLYVCGWQGRHAPPDGCWYRLVADTMETIAEAVEFDTTAQGPDGWRGTAYRLAEPQTRGAEADDAARPGDAPPPTEEPDFLRSPAPPEPAPPRPLAPSRPATAEPAVLSPLAEGPGEGRFLRGRLIHWLLQLLPDAEPAARDALCRRLLARPGHGLTAEAQAEIAAEVLAVIDDARFAALFGPTSRAEVPLAGVVDGAVVAGQVDRLVVGADRVTVIDYKTNRPAPDREADVAPAYIAQMAAYRAVLEQIYPDKTIVCLLLWTDGPHLMQLSDAALIPRVSDKGP